MGIKTGKKALFTEINITPLTDIFLVLLIIMMVVAPTFQSVDNSISIPEVNSGVAIEQGKVVVSVTKDGTIYVDSKKEENKKGWNFVKIFGAFVLAILAVKFAKNIFKKS